MPRVAEQRSTYLVGNSLTSTSGSQCVYQMSVLKCRSSVGYRLFNFVDSVFQPAKHRFDRLNISKRPHIHLVVQLGALVCVRALPVLADEHEPGDEDRLDRLAAYPLPPQPPIRASGS